MDTFLQNATILRWEYSVRIFFLVPPQGPMGTIFQLRKTDLGMAVIQGNSLIGPLPTGAACSAILCFLENPLYEIRATSTSVDWDRETLSLKIQLFRKTDFFTDPLFRKEDFPLVRTNKRDSANDRQFYLSNASPMDLVTIESHSGADYGYVVLWKDREIGELNEKAAIFWKEQGSQCSRVILKERSVSGAGNYGGKITMFFPQY